MEDNFFEKCVAMLSASIKLTIETGRANGYSDTEILNVIHASAVQRVKGYEDEELEFVLRAKKGMQERL